MESKKPTCYLKIVILGVIILPLLTTMTVGQQTTVFPNAEWMTDTPEKHGIRTNELNRAADDIRWTVFRYCFLVIKDGHLIYERYYFGDKDSKHKGYSLTKSLTSILVGIAASKGLVQLNDRISSYIEPPKGMNQNATIKHVLGQVSESNPPGSGFKYRNKEIVNSLGRIVSLVARKSGLAIHSEDFANKYREHSVKAVLLLLKFKQTKNKFIF